MIVDKLKRLKLYQNLGLPVKEILEFVEQAKTNLLVDGRHDILGDDLFALVQRYDTKEEIACLPESHLKYIDLQYVLEGEEVLLWDFAEELTVVDDKRPEADIRFHEKKPPLADVVLKKDMFAILYPEDAHTPCLHHETVSTVQKIVFKIKVNHKDNR